MDHNRTFLMTRHFPSKSRKKNTHEIILISGDNNNPSLSMDVCVATCSHYYNTLFDYFSCHQSHPIMVGSFNMMAFNINKWSQTIF